MTYQRANIEAMTGYTPGEQPTSSEVIKLNTNENPYPPTPIISKRLADFPVESLRRYPSPTAEAFRIEAAKRHGLSPDQVVATNGGDELLRLILTTFVEPSSDAARPIGLVDPSYSLYDTLAAIHDCPIHRTDLNDDWSLPADLADQFNAANVALTIIVNPQAPSGQLIPQDQIAKLASDLNGLLLIDEAYIDFVDPAHSHDLCPLVNEHDNLLLLRTLSKGYSLAGLRFGYGLGPAALIDPIQWKTKDSYNTDAIAQMIATEAIADQAYAQTTWQAVRRDRAQLLATFEQMGLNPVDSQTNFILIQTPQASSIYESLKRDNIFVRYFNLPRLQDRLRITIGTPQQNDQLLTALQQLER